MKKILATIAFVLVSSSSSFAWDYLLCEASGVTRYGGYSIDLSKNLQGELSPHVQLPVSLKGYTVDLSIYKDLLRITLKNTKTGLKTLSIGDFKGFGKVMLYSQVSAQEAKEIGLTNGNDMIYVECFTSDVSDPEVYKRL